MYLKRRNFWNKPALGLFLLERLLFGAMNTKTILYIHGMGGGGDSRIPSILNDLFRDRYPVNVVVRTYDFDPEAAAVQIAGWVEELKPALIIGESLGSIHAIRVKGIPHILISPSLNAPLYLGYLSWIALIPGVTWLFDRIYKPKDGDRQALHFVFGTLRKYRRHRRIALANATSSGSSDYFHAFIGARDHYRRSGIVSLRTWKKHFGETYTIYDGTHFTEEEYICSLVVPKILEVTEL